MFFFAFLLGKMPKAIALKGVWFLVSHQKKCKEAILFPAPVIHLDLEKKKPRIERVFMDFFSLKYQVIWGSF